LLEQMQPAAAPAEAAGSPVAMSMSDAE
jgi:hypothetical protein